MNYDNIEWIAKDFTLNMFEDKVYTPIMLSIALDMSYTEFKDNLRNDEEFRNIISKHLDLIQNDLEKKLIENIFDVSTKKYIKFLLETHFDVIEYRYKMQHLLKQNELQDTYNNLLKDINNETLSLIKEMLNE